MVVDWYISVAFCFSQAAIYFIVDTLILNTLCLYLLNSFKHTKGFINFCFILGEFVGGFIISIYLYMGYFVCNMVWYMKDLLIMKNIFYKRKSTQLHIIGRYCRQL